MTQLAQQLIIAPAEYAARHVIVQLDEAIVLGIALAGLITCVRLSKPIAATLCLTIFLSSAALFYCKAHGA